ncbi:BMP family ABC transporter substrate-binding protein [Thermogladius sp. KZ2Tp1]|uniref:BMP family ABC transporter substrate-binding protein n=1 Tax=Thermogladius sp. KZ2Tp1 TaxID=3136289 RepID=UPI003DAA1ECB
MSPKVLTTIFVIIIIIVGVAAFYAGTSMAPAKTVTQTVGAGGTVTTTITQTITQTQTPTWTPPSTIKAAWVYVGPIGDFGWTYAHDVGRRVTQQLYKDWLQTTYVESITADQLPSVIDNLVSQGYNVIFTTSFDFMENTIKSAQKYPNVIFFHCSGYMRAPNVGTYFADLYQAYYLDGLLAGALTKTGQIGYVAAVEIPEVVRHINAFAIGAQEVAQQLGKNVTVHVIVIGGWVAPDKARQAVQTLFQTYNVDTFAFTEDTPTVIQTVQQLYASTGKQLYVFSHYSPGYTYGTDVVVSGQIVHWETIYVDILAKIKAGVYTPYNLQNVDYWYLMNTGAVDAGAHIYSNGSIMYINPKFVDTLKSIMVTDKVTGMKMSVYDLFMERMREFQEAPILENIQEQADSHVYETVVGLKIPPAKPGVSEPATEWSWNVAPVFDPFTGPLTFWNISNPSQLINVPAGARLGHDDLWSMQYYLYPVVHRVGAI